MKRYLTLIILPLASLMLSGCLANSFSPDTWAIDPELSLSISGLVFTSIESSQVVEVETNYSYFSINSSEEWCVPSANTDEGKITIQVKQNKGISQRQATVTVTVRKGTKSLSRDLDIVQLGGYWDMAGSFSLFWGYDVSDSQKEIIKDLLGNMVYVEGGTFEMGYDEWYGALPAHSVTLSDFYISKYELTQKEWNAVMGSNDSRYIGANKPVEIYSWNDAFDFTVKLSNLTGLDFRLPTEAQWEYAAKGGKYSHGYIYPGSDTLEDVAVIATVSEESPQYSTADVGTLFPNELGLYDMAGNVAEICSDWYSDTFVSNVTINPTGPPTGKYHVSKGGDFSDYSYEYSPYMRNSYADGIDIISTGIRLLMAI